MREGRVHNREEVPTLTWDSGGTHFLCLGSTGRCDVDVTPEVDEEISRRKLLDVNFLKIIDVPRVGWRRFCGRHGTKEEIKLSGFLSRTSYLVRSPLPTIKTSVKSSASSTFSKVQLCSTSFYPSSTTLFLRLHMTYGQYMVRDSTHSKVPGVLWLSVHIIGLKMSTLLTPNISNSQIGFQYIR